MTPKAKGTSALTSKPAIQNGFSLISNEKLLQLYSMMLKCQAIRERLGFLINEGKLTVNLETSCGPATVGLIVDLLPEDTIAPHPGDIIPLFIRGLSLKELFATRVGKLAARPRSQTNLSLQPKRPN